MSYAELRAECVKQGYVGKDMDGFDLCGPGGCLCSGHSCPSKKYWNKGHRQPGYYKDRALERTGLVTEFKKEMS
jgi:hypothetical protein